MRESRGVVPVRVQIGDVHDISIGKIPSGFVFLDGAECGREEGEGGSAETALVTVLNSRQPALTQRLR